MVKTETATSAIHQALQDFAGAVRSKSTTIATGEPEDQLRAPFESLMRAVGMAQGWEVVPTGETRLPDSLGCPDYAIHRDKQLTGYTELKAPGTGADASRFKGRNQEQFKRFSSVPNILYTDGNEWALYRSGERTGRHIKFSGNITSDGSNAITKNDSKELGLLLQTFFLWKPELPLNRNGSIDLQGFAKILAPLCRMLRDDVIDALKHIDSRLVILAKEWRQLLFPDATDEQFADSYAQTVTFALLLGRSEGADPLTLDSAKSSLDNAQHNLLSRALQILTDGSVREEMSASLDLLLLVISTVPLTAFSGTQDPWLYFYENFLAIYDPKLRKDAGAYYTPVEVVKAQVQLVDNILSEKLNKRWGFAESDVITLDPAVGTGTYLLTIIEHSLKRISDEQGPGAVEAQANNLAKNLYGFERMVGPYAVADLRISRTLNNYGASLKDGGAHLYLTDTLESPNTEPPQLALFLEPISVQHQKALEIKRDTQVIVCIGNPPYDRHEAATPYNGYRTGSWVRWGDNHDSSKAIFSDFIGSAKGAERRERLKNLSNLYVYFWRWALWKVFEHESSSDGGVVSFISASSYLDGKAFEGMREHMRRLCDEIWILDLGGEGRGSRTSENIFDIQTPVAIAVALRSNKKNNNQPAEVHYAKIEGTRQEKLETLNSITDFQTSSRIVWQKCSDEFQAPFRPHGNGIYFSWPKLTDIMPWQHSGVQVKRKWPIAPDKDTLKLRWQKLLQSENRSVAFVESPERTIDKKYSHDFTGKSISNSNKKESISELPQNASMPKIERYSYRSLDRQYIIADNRLISCPRPPLWFTYSSQQIYFTSLLTQVLGNGPALIATALIPDLDHFRGSYGGKHVIPLYLDSDASKYNFIPDLVDELSHEYSTKIKPLDLFAYIYGVLAHPAFTQRFFDELETRELHIPITKHYELFEKSCKIGSNLIWLHTYGNRFPPKNNDLDKIPNGTAKCTKAIPTSTSGYPNNFSYNADSLTLCVGEGRFAPISQEVFEYEVSGLKVVYSWLKYRMRDGAGRTSSPLDKIRPKNWTAELTNELLELLWVLESTLELHPEQEKLLDEILARDCFTISELSDPLDKDHELRKPPKLSKESEEDNTLV